MSTNQKEKEEEVKVKGKKVEGKTDIRTMEDAVKRYSEKWNVSEKVAAQKLLNYIEGEGKDKPAQAENVPQMGDIFPNPITEFSKRVQGINQALLSTEWTKRNISELRQPPQALQEIAEIRGKVSSLESTIQDQLKSLQETLEAKNQQEAQREILEKFDEMMKPLSEKIATLEEVVKGKPEAEGKLIKTNAELATAYGEATDAAQEFLKGQGFLFGKKPVGSQGMSAADQLKIYETLLTHQDKKDDRSWEREKWREEQKLKTLEITEREKTIRGIAKDGFKRAQPLIDAFTEEGEKRLRGSRSPSPTPGQLESKGATAANIFTCPGCGTEIPVKGEPMRVVCPECKKVWAKQ